MENEPSDSNKKRSFWDTTTGIIAKIAALIAAITGLVVAIRPLLSSSKTADTTTLSASVDPSAGQQNKDQNNNPGNGNDKKPDPETKFVPSTTDISSFLNAAKTGDLSTLQTYLDKGMDADASQNGDATTALVNAIDNNQPAAVKLLLDHHANNSVNIRGNSFPIIEAAFWGRAEIVSYLVETKPDLNVQKLDPGRMTALMFACVNGHKDVVGILIKNGADVNIKSSINNATALDFANSSTSPNKPEILAALFAVGARVGN